MGERISIDAARIELRLSGWKAEVVSNTIRASRRHQHIAVYVNEGTVAASAVSWRWLDAQGAPA